MVVSAPAHPVVYLLPAATVVERDLIDQWAGNGAQGTPAEIVAREALDGRLRQGDDPVVTPVRVAWLPRERDGARTARWSDFLAGHNPRSPSARRQRAIRAREPDRCRVVVGEPAPVSELRARFDEAVGGDAGDGDFADFVGRQASLALDRAERGLFGSQYKVPRFVVEEIVASASWRRGIARLADELDVPRDEVASRAARYLEEMAASQGRMAVDLMGHVQRWMARAYQVDLNPDRLDDVRKLGEKHALVFLPSHRSYLDPLVLRPVLLRHGFPPNHVMGGINMAVWPLGDLAKRSGMVFIRRSFSDNAVYKWTLREYMAYLVRKRFNLEWYIEGGRTRTGKLRPPRYGLLTYVAEAFRRSDVEDVYLVPVSIAYDQLHEVGAMAAEARGASKRAESLGWLVDYVRAQGRKLGRVHVALGEPLSLREALDAEEELRSGVVKTALEVSHRINRVTPTTATALVTLALLGMEDRALTLAEIQAVLDPFLEYLAARGLPVPGELRVGRTGGTQRALRALSGNGVVTTFEGGVEPVYAIGRDQHLVAAFYRNSIIHFFVNRAIAELVWVAAAEGRLGGDREQTWADVMRLRDLLKFEFFFAEKEEFRQEMRAEMTLIDPQWIDLYQDPEGLRAGLHSLRPYMAHRVLQSFLEAYAVVSERLAARDPREPVQDGEFLAECEGVARQYRMQQRIGSGESISRELFAAALKLAANRDLVDPGREELSARRAEFASEVTDAVRRIGVIRELASRELQRPAVP
jgi:glycerol-3-phosphate O-acyltransferase